jgi:hypothetical protein
MRENQKCSKAGCNKNNCYRHRVYDVEGWLHKTFSFNDDREYIIFLVWALFVVSFFASMV